jgi:hypothetical protein
LALAYLHRARPDETTPLTDLGERDLQTAAAFAGDLGHYSELSGDRRFDLYRMVLNSRIQRKRDCLEKAQAWAKRVLGDKQVAGVDGVFVDALIARGEARMRGGDLSAASEDFAQSLSITRNPRTRAICLLYLCELDSRRGNSREAARRMAEFERLKPSVTHHQIRTLEMHARASIERNNKDLLLRLTDNDLNPERVEGCVRHFLVEWAKARSESDSEAAKLLGVSRQTLYNWTKASPMAK